MTSIINTQIKTKIDSFIKMPSFFFDKVVGRQLILWYCDREKEKKFWKSLIGFSFDVFLYHSNILISKKNYRENHFFLSPNHIKWLINRNQVIINVILCSTFIPVRICKLRPRTSCSEEFWLKCVGANQVRPIKLFFSSFFLPSSIYC